jgi:hypothetical protein
VSAVLLKGVVLSSSDCSECLRVDVENVTLRENKTTYVQCSASGQSIENITWRRQSEIIRNATNATDENTGLRYPSYFTIHESVDEMLESGLGLKSMLILWNSQRAMAGHYSCEASNGTHTASETFHIQVHPIIVPNFHKDKSKTFKEGSYLELSCVAQSYPKPVIKWKLGGKDLIESGCTHDLHINETQTVDDYPNCKEGCPIASCSIYAVEDSFPDDGLTGVSTTKSRLVVRELSTSDSGTYECVATANETNLSSRNSTLIRVHSKLSMCAMLSISVVYEIITQLFIVIKNTFIYA